MDKYEYKVRADEIKSLIAEGEYAEAAKIADTIDWRRVRSVMMLCTISDLYKINRRYEDSRDILLLAYEKGGGRRPIVYSLCELSIKLEEYVQAIEYYKEFVQLAPKDSGRYILQYKLYEAQDVSLEERIAVLEELKKKDYREKWAYELAYLYHRVGLETKCVEECDELFLWFSEGRYVLKALELKKLHRPLSPEQEDRYEQMKQTGGSIEAELVTEGKAIAKEAVAPTEDEEDDEYSRQQNVLTDPTQELPGKELADEIQVKTVDVSQYNTINLQKELAESMKEFLETAASAEAADAGDEGDTKVMEPIVHTEQYFAEDTQPGDTDADTQTDTFAQMDDFPQTETFAQTEALKQEIPAGEESAEDAPAISLRQDTDEMQLISDEMLPGQQASQEVFFGNTSEVNVDDVVSELVEQDAQAAKAATEMQTAAEPAMTAQHAAEMHAVQQSTAEAQQAPTLQNSSLSDTGIIRTFHKPSGYDDMLSQEYDGQISMAIPEEEKVEKQITGQLSIDDVMSEWEKIKKDNEQKMLQEIKERVHKQTDSLFADFDEATKTGLLEELEKAMVDAAIRDSKKKAEDSQPKVVKVSDIGKAAADAENAEEFAQTAEIAEEAEDVEETDALSGDTADAADDADTLSAVAPDSGDDTDTDAVADTDVEETEDEIDADENAEEQEKAPAETDSEEEADDTEAVDTAEESDDTADESDDSAEPAEESAAVQHVEAAADAGMDNSEKYAAREMTKNELEQFAPFIHHRKTRRQIVDVIDHMSLASYTGNVVITGEEGTGTTALAKLLVKEVQLSDNNFSGKVAKISGTNMNKRDVASTLAKLSGGALIVEGAAAMKKPTVEALVRELNQEGKGIILILEDKKEDAEKFLAKYPALQPLFNLRVDVEALDDQTLVKYAKKYAYEQEYSIDEFAVLALHKRIEDMQTLDHEVTLAEIEELIDEAIYYADKKTPKHFFDILFGKRYDDEDMIILQEKDFRHI